MICSSNQQPKIYGKMRNIKKQFICGEVSHVAARKQLGGCSKFGY